MQALDNSDSIAQIKIQYPQSESDANLPQQKQEKQQKAVSFFQLFRFAQPLDYLLMGLGTVASIIMGGALPSFSLLWGNMIDSFGGNGQDMVDSALESFLLFIYLGIGVFFAAWIMFGTWMVTGERQAIACRKEYLKKLLVQQVGWFDMTNQSQLASKFATDTFAFQQAIGQKIATFFMTIGMLISGFVIGFIKGWLLAVVVLAIIPAILVAGIMYMFIVQNKDKRQKAAYSQAGGKVQQALSSIKTVKQLNGEIYQASSYRRSLQKASQGTLKYGLLSGVGIGFMMCAMMCSYALGFWWGSVLVERKQPNFSSSTGIYTPGDVLVVFFSILMAGFNLSQLTPSLQKIGLGKQAAARIYQILDRQPLIKNPQNGLRPQNFNGIIKFQNVSFSYPKDKNRKILNHLNIQFDVNSSALVGQSGCGKSTIVQLIMRFYDPDEGRVTLNGIDLKQYDLGWLRSQMGYVGQQPVLFAASIRENLLFGKQDATQEQMNQALVKAEAYDFIQTLQEKLETYVGYGGGQLSGGQKQRIAIARAILKKPKILLLDEATSALDRRNEKLIQNTLEKISQNRTSITIAHRVRTIMNNNTIYVIDRGQVLQKGKFNQLERYKGHHYENDDDQKLKPSQMVDQNSKRPRKASFKGQIVINEEEAVLMTKEEKAKKQQEQITKIYQDNIFSRLFKYVTDKIPLFILAILLNIGSGTIFPIFSIFLSSMLTTLFKFSYINPTTNMEQLRNEANYYVIVFVVLGVAFFIGKFLGISIYAVIAQSMTRKIRLQTYEKMLKMPIAWYDIPRNNAGTLAARLSTDCQIVNGLITTYVSLSIQNITSLLTGIVIALVFQWRTSLVAIALIPLMIIAGAIKMKMSTGFSEKTDQAYKDSSNLIMETLINIRTVKSFGYEDVVQKKYAQKLEGPASLSIKKGNCSGLLFGLSQFTMFLVFGLIFFIGTIFIRDFPDQVDSNKVFTAIFAIMFSAMTVGNTSIFMPDIAQGKNSAANLFIIQDDEDEQQRQTKQNSKMLREGCKGDIQIKKICFKYSSRKQTLFQNFSLKIKNGNKVAFVGTSGCGKSTIIQLLLRFYEPESGQISINGINIKDFDIHYLRSCFGVVSQQPVLFQGNFRDNIIYNLEGASEDQMIIASSQANATSFITGNQKLEIKIDKKTKSKSQTSQQGEQTKMKTGFDKQVGVKGSHISGGQKQRIAIARAILRHPDMLLLDEATSALDRENEKKVQSSLDQIMKGKTTISIAHRLQTIHNSDEIFVFEKGKVAEQGNYQTLISKRGYFYNLEKGTQFI